LVNIRLKHNLTQEAFAKDLGYPTDYIIDLESNRQQASFEFVAALKDKYNLHNTPITESERAALMESLYNWKIIMDYGDMAKAAQLKPILEKSARASYSPSTINLYDLYAAGYYWVTSDMESYNKTMEALEQRSNEFSARHLYHYNRLMAARKYVENNYHEALQAFKTAEKLDKKSEWGGVGFYYGYGKCLSDMGYAARAIDYLRKAQHLGTWSKIYDGKPNRRFDIDIDCSLAGNLSKISRVDEALKILDRRVSIEMKRNNKKGIGLTYLGFGSVYLRAKDYDKAVDNFDMSFRYLDEYDEAFKTSLYRKALALIESDNIQDGLLYISRGLNMQTMGDIRRVLLEALNCSVSMDEPKSLEYLETVIMPKLLKYGQYMEVVKYFKLLSEFYSEKSNYVKALEYSNSALKIHEMLYEERVERGL